MKKVFDLQNVASDCATFIVNYYDGSRRQILVNDNQFHLKNNMIIFSRADINGVINHVNNAFVEASGWTRQELIGQPHSIVRHPHMPAAVFAELWATIKAGRQWTGCVKNLRKDGGYYWVRAIVCPIYKNDKLIGYNSVRREIDKQTIDEYEALYAQMRKQEKVVA